VLHNLCIFQRFFFSSRRRHTRFSRDWSSDVCSSDLPKLLDQAAFKGDEELGARVAYYNQLNSLSPLSSGAVLLKDFKRKGRSSEIGRASCRERVYISVVVVREENTIKYLFTTITESY